MSYHKSDNEVLRKTRDIINMHRQSLGIVVTLVTTWPGWEDGNKIGIF